MKSEELSAALASRLRDSLLSVTRALGIADEDVEQIASTALLFGFLTKEPEHAAALTDESLTRARQAHAAMVQKYPHVSAGRFEAIGVASAALVGIEDPEGDLSADQLALFAVRGGMVVGSLLVGEVDIKLIAAGVISNAQRSAALKRHSETNEMKARARSFYRERKDVLTKDAAAEAFARLEPIKFRTVRDWLRGQ